MKAATNAGRLVSQVLTGEVWPPLADRHGYRVGPDGQPFALKRLATRSRCAALARATRRPGCQPT